MGHSRAARHAEVDTDVLTLRANANRNEGPASAGPSFVRRTAAAFVAALLLAGCAVGGGGEEVGSPPPDLPEELAVPAVVHAGAGSGGSPGASGTAGGAAGAATGAGATSTAAGSSAPPGSAGGPSGPTSTTAASGEPAAPYVTRLTLTDRTGDAGLQARPYGDLVLHRLEDDGSRARFTVQMAGDLPPQPAEGEVIGIGVDLIRGGDDDSGHQVYVLGNADGWRAWVHEPDGRAVKYDGTVAVDGSAVVVTVPWTALGGRRAGSVHVFADWSQGRVAVVADASEDHAPDRGTSSFSVGSS